MRDKTVATNDSLLDIGKNMEALTGDEKLFYSDQRTERIGWISSDIDLKYEIEQEEILAMEIENIEREEQEYLHAMVDNEYDHLNSTQVNDNELNQS